MDATRNNIEFARNRDQARDEWLDVHPSTAAQLVKAGIYPTVEKARQRLRQGEKRQELAYLAHVKNRQGYREALYARFEVQNPQHEYEITELILAARPDAIRRGYQVGPKRPDAELLFGNQVTYLERERSRKSLDRVRERIEKYDDKDIVCWVVDTDTRIKNIIRTCKPPANHYFSTYRQAVENWREESIWQTNKETN